MRMHEHSPKRDLISYSRGLESFQACRKLFTFTPSESLADWAWIGRCIAMLTSDLWCQHLLHANLFFQRLPVTL